MHFEVPECKRCCLCLPLRHGILTIGYLNLAFTVLIVGFELWLDFGYPITSYTMRTYRGVGIFAQMWLPYLLDAFEIIFIIVLLIGAHTKRSHLIRAFYYYGIMTTVAACLTFVVVRFENQYEAFYFSTLEFCMAFLCFVIQVYLLLLCRTELRKLKYQQGQFSYVNHTSEVLLEPHIDNGRNPL